MLTTSLINLELKLRNNSLYLPQVGAVSQLPSSLHIMMTSPLSVYPASHVNIAAVLVPEVDTV